ncbi:ribulose-phosphate 3-epimerase [candidate division WOR-1 bacterium RIFOXYA12_FULL_52_29]|uniref:Ribulose-phosphate 3-epimerase n=1 Tax=candidate division WOR-1 bacterium RIFOXYC12_FULL_54_18 TaxID=1802584 RepID=A0A1F4T7I9_UNCSA|nr:MAG: ribulose-phosphate 3-epimerase [candidate division WOR-1 bacterium RIFOXYA2_FULL_51_19]OGC18093.1 MAG: ribulose-phosphate 3-epimerase [candidate division WOR-1 bacterium RIFOXYA12_FULL_52_29]OGC26949.1 MAG: ribulose-phosphate 3-epimerase [candidate division WOR-1 bacterium RIFOXYB2_FULL_45_9]OGC28510.1 MAG: ribulose-phosphate 3-epimerase [candidate division WOR-1 bacterium RIFOXYC12_FULL_54_18]OGC31035.1 MAG: ribulose-phosphate 3-epimerase [candidate division WOR-1 bacterium RIFOXYB12_F
MKTLIAPSILSADFRTLEAEIKKVEAAGADLIHIDVMDGHFVPNITIGALVVKACRKATKLPLDVHLMIENPDRFIPDFARAGADLITIHVESSKNLDSDIELIRQNNARPGVVVNPATPVESIFHVLEKIDMVLLMSVNPGFEGQKFMPEVLPKIKALKSLVVSRKLSVDIEVDGGINLETAKEVVKAGANVLVAGSAIFYAADPPAVIRQLKAS